MKIAILQCDSVLPQFLKSFPDYPEMIKVLFSNIDPAIQFQTFNVQENQYPADLRQFDAFVTTGSKSSVYDGDTWISALEQFLVSINDQNKKLIGICFGHQLVAQVFGGKTEKSQKGWGVGIHSSTIKIEKSWMQPELNTLNLVVSHQDQVSQLPPGAELIAGHDFCPIFMFQLGENILTVQGHPEFNKFYAETMMNYRKEKIGENTLKTGLNSLTLPTHEQQVARWFVNFIQQR